MLKSEKAKQFKLSILAMALATLPLGADAAGLGRLTVTSTLGQPLRAQIEVTASRDELASLSARMASADAFKNAGIDYTPALSGIRFTLDKRPDGKVFVVASSDRAFNEPFVDMLVEMNWASGRLVREYTFLLDPPEVLKKPEAPAPVAVPEVKREAPVAAAPQPAPSAQALAPAPTAPSPTPTPKRAAQPAAPSGEPAQPKPSAADNMRQVVKGDTLGKIAGQLKPAGVNLDQMLAALFLGNKDAFDGGNMNRLRAGKILRIPDSEVVAAVEPVEARKMVVAQAVDFNAYRRKLAGVAAAEAAKEEAPKQSVSGKIAPKVEEKAPPAATGKDKLEVSPTEAGKGAKSAARIGAIEEDLVARDKELKEAQGRIAALEKNLSELRKLAEMKAAAGAKPAEPPAAAQPEKPAPALVVPAAPVEPPKPAEPPMAAEPTKPAEPPKPAEAPKELPKAVEPPPPPPSFIEENPEIVFGGGAIIALILGYLGFNAWRRKRQAAEAESADEAESSVFGTSGDQTVDTGAAPPTDFSVQPGDTSGDEGVDPVAEADVYIAYGRDSQAEEILLEALKTDPTRTAIHVKLLEIYAARKDLASFESVARELYGLTGGIGPDWERAQLLGRSIDPANPLYGGSEAASAPEPLDMTATVITTAAGLRAATAEKSTEAPAAPEQKAAVEEAPGSLDFDLDLSAPPAGEAPAATEQAAESTSLDFDLGSAPEAEAATSAEGPAPLDFEIDMPAVEPEAKAATEGKPAEAADASGLDFDFDLSEPAAAVPETPAVEEPVPAAMPALDLPAVEQPATPAAAPSFDLGSISLDLDESPAASAPSPVPTPIAAAPVAPVEPETTALIDDPEVATKLELAQAYEEMGDKEGARELLNEVLNEGSPAQQEAARQKLASLA